MSRIAKATERERPYRSQLRADQGKETRARILDATIRVQARGLAILSVPAVAREAGVSVPTIYRHFRTKQHLVAAVYPHAMFRAGGNVPPAPETLDDLKDATRAYLAHLESLDAETRAAMASPASDETRRATMPRRLEILGRFADAVAPNASATDRTRITRLMAILTASAALRLWRDHLGASVDEVADDLDWIVRAVVAATGKRPHA